MSKYTAVFRATYYVDFEAEGKEGDDDFEDMLNDAIEQAENSGTPSWTLDNIMETV